jgi:hypothetical protein
MSTLTYDQYKKRWADPHYALRVSNIASQLNSDGCSGVPEFYYMG